MIRSALLVAAWLFLLASPAGGEARVVDATGRAVAVPEAQRIVVAGGSLTEIVYALGLEDRLVAVDSTSLHPEAATAKPNIGYLRQLAAEPIVALEPSLLLAEQDAGPPEVLQQLRDAGVPVVLVPDRPSPEGVLEKVELVARALGGEEKGRALAAALAAEFERVARAVAGAGRRPRVLFLLSIGDGGAPLAAGRGTSAEGIVRLAGGENAVEGFERYKPLSPEAAVAARPDVLLVTTRSLGLLGGPEALLKRPELASTPAARAGRIVAMDGLLLLGFGPRTGQAVAELARHLHPELGPALAAAGADK